MASSGVAAAGFLFGLCAANHAADASSQGWDSAERVWVAGEFGGELGDDGFAGVLRCDGECGELGLFAVPFGEAGDA